MRTYEKLRSVQDKAKMDSVRREFEGVAMGIRRIERVIFERLEERKGDDLD